MISFCGTIKFDQKTSSVSDCLLWNTFNLFKDCFIDYSMSLPYKNLNISATLFKTQCVLQLLTTCSL